MVLSRNILKFNFQNQLKNLVNNLKIVFNILTKFMKIILII
jgi:hypothetical protein